MVVGGEGSVEGWTVGTGFDTKGRPAGGADIEYVQRKSCKGICAREQKCEQGGEARKRG